MKSFKLCHLLDVAGTATGHLLFQTMFSLESSLHMDVALHCTIIWREMSKSSHAGDGNMIISLCLSGFGRIMRLIYSIGAGLLSGLCMLSCMLKHVVSVHSAPVSLQ